jgi:peroxiredoxin
MVLCLLAYELDSNAKDRDTPQKGKLAGITLQTASDSVVRLGAVSNYKASVFIFLSPECPIAQQSTLEINRLVQKFKDAGIAFYGVIAGSYYSKEEVLAFASTYKLAFPMLMDNEYALAHALNGTITPQAVVVGNDESLLYTGAIDNAYRALGAKNARTTAHYLRNALTAIQAQKEIIVKQTTPVGCLVEGKKHAGKK